MSSRRTPVMLRATACLGAVAAIGASAWRAAPWEALEQPASASAGSAVIELGDRSAGLDHSALGSTKKARTTLVSAHSSSHASPAKASGSPSAAGKAKAATSGADAAAGGLVVDQPVNAGAAGSVGGADTAGTAGSTARQDSGPSSVPAAPTQAPAPGQPVYVLMDQAASDAGEGSQGAKAASTAAPTVRPTSAPTSTAPGRPVSADESERSSAPATTKASRAVTTKTTTKAPTPTPTPKRTDDN